jgi:hypothetical protein
MKNIAPVVGFVVGIALIFIAMVFSAPRKGDVIIINCSISEISPDFTTEMREACRQARKIQK